MISQSRLVYQAEQDRVAAARAALPPVESILGLDEMQVGVSYHSPDSEPTGYGRKQQSRS